MKRQVLRWFKVNKTNLLFVFFSILGGLFTYLSILLYISETPIPGILHALLDHSEAMKTDFEKSFLKENIPLDLITPVIESLVKEHPLTVTIPNDFHTKVVIPPTLVTLGVVLYVIPVGLLLGIIYLIKYV